MRSIFKLNLFRGITGAPGPFQTVVHGFGRYRDTFESLPLLERLKVLEVADDVARSFEPGGFPILKIRLVGHADTDFERGKAFEQKISEQRAKEIQKALANEIQRLTFKFNPLKNAPPSVLSQIQFDVTGVGATEPAEENVKRHKTPANMREDDRQLNRRVEIFLEPSIVPIPPTPQTRPNIWVTYQDPAIQAVIQTWWDEEQRKNRSRWAHPFPAPQRSDEWRDFVKDFKKRFKGIDLKTAFDMIHDMIAPPDQDWTNDFMRAWQEIEEERRQRGLDPLGDDDDD